MFFFLKYLSRSVHDDQEHNEEIRAEAEAEAKKKIGSEGISSSSSFTVWKKSLVISCNGFTVINSNGDLVYRVDNYSLHPQELTLMDASGKSILTMLRRKKFGVDESWEVYEGEASGNCSKMVQKPAIWSVKKRKNILEAFNNNIVLAYVLKGNISEKRRYSYVIEGCYRNRSCKVMDQSRRLMAEIKRKEAMIGGISFGEEVFVLVVQFGFDPGFAMALVLLLDQMFS